MDPVVLAMIVETVVTLIVVVAFAVFMKKLLARATSAETPDGRTIPAAGSWSALEARFATSAPAAEPVVRAASIMVGGTAWKNCVAIGVEAEGLHLSIRVPLLGAFGRKPLLIPWDEIVESAPTRLYWGPARRLVIGRPTIATLTLTESIFETILARGHLVR